MKRFASAREAKIYLIDRILHEAERKGIRLSETERKTLYVSNTGWNPHDHDEGNEAFERECDQLEYERRISALILSARDAARKEGSAASASWRNAVAALGREDHYLMVLFQVAYGTIPASNGEDEGVSYWHILRLVLTGLLAGAAVFGIAMWLLH